MTLRKALSLPLYFYVYLFLLWNDKNISRVIGYLNYQIGDEDINKLVIKKEGKEGQRQEITARVLTSLSDYGSGHSGLFFFFVP